MGNNPLLINSHHQSACGQTCALTLLQVCARVRVFVGQVEKGAAPASVQPVLKGDFPEWLHPKQPSARSASGGESLSPACFVVSLKRSAAVSIKRHRSEETPPTEIPTEEAEEEGSGRLTDRNIKDGR